MKTLSLVCLAVLVVGSPSLRASGVAGAVTGHGSGHRHYRGNGHARVSAAPRAYLYRNSGHHHVGHYRGYRHSVYRWGYPGYYYRPGYVYLGFDSYAYPYAGDYEPYYARPSYAANGALLGALAGAVIGNNSGDLRHNGWAGAGLGAAAGYLVGSIAENNARRREAAFTERPVDTRMPTEVQVTSSTPASAPDQTVTVSKSKPSSAMSSANELFGR